MADMIRIALSAKNIYKQGFVLLRSYVFDVILFVYQEIGCVIFWKLEVINVVWPSATYILALKEAVLIGFS